MMKSTGTGDAVNRELAEQAEEAGDNVAQPHHAGVVQASRTCRRCAR